MLNSLKRWLGGRGTSGDIAAAQAWAEGRGYHLRRDHQGAKFLIEGQFDQHRWRLEYGAPQRHYIEGQELRMRMELHLPPMLHLMLMSRTLVEKLESAAFERFTQSLETHIDAASPEEMRWLAMYPKVPLPPSQPALKPYYGMVASSPNAAQTWLHGRFADRAAEFGAGSLQGAPFVLMTLRGRMYLRLEAFTLPVELLDETVALFRVAAGRAREVLSNWAEEGDGTWANTTSTAWHTEELDIRLPEDKAP